MYYKFDKFDKEGTSIKEDNKDVEEDCNFTIYVAALKYGYIYT